MLGSGYSRVSVSAALSSHAVIHHVIPDGGNADTERGLVSAAAVHSGKDTHPLGGQRVDSPLFIKLTFLSLRSSSARWRSQEGVCGNQLIDLSPASHPSVGLLFDSRRWGCWR